MYPLTTPEPYPREQWYVAGTGDEFGRTFIGRQILGAPLVFYRTEAGQPVALWGLCPHRLMPLERGSLHGDTVVCGYHGFVFAANGACIDIPATTGISPACRVRSYPLVERGPWVWIWMGEGPADHTRLPDASDIGLGDDPSGWRIDVTKTFKLNARSQLLIDNLMDLSHLAYIHSSSIIDGAKIALETPEVLDCETRLTVKRTLADVPTTSDPFIALLMPEYKGRIWSELRTDVYGPGLINASGPCVWSSRADGSRGDHLLQMNFVHAITPAGPNETHYFGVLTRNFRFDDEQLTAILVASNDRVRAEDVAALEAIERYADSHGVVEREISIKADLGGIMMRRRMSKLIADERPEPAAAAPSR